jgi:hypothetical protein
VRIFCFLEGRNLGEKRKSKCEYKMKTKMKMVLILSFCIGFEKWFLKSILQNEYKDFRGGFSKNLINILIPTGEKMREIIVSVFTFQMPDDMIYKKNYIHIYNGLRFLYSCLFRNTTYERNILL